jgi:hypothetical protein
MFQGLNTNKERKIYSHFTCATGEIFYHLSKNYILFSF